MTGGGDAAVCSSTMNEQRQDDEDAAAAAAAVLGESVVNAQLRQFAEQFRLRRMRLGATQADVGAALAVLRSTPLSQSTICRFESLTLTPRKTTSPPKRPGPIFRREYTSCPALRHVGRCELCLLYTSPSPRDRQKSRMPSSA